MVRSAIIVATVHALLATATGDISLAPAPAPAGPAGPAGPISTGLDNPMPLKAAEQGFHGADVQHKDGSTMIGDWRREYGPKGPQALQSFGRGKSLLASSRHNTLAAPAPAPAGPAGPAGPISTGLDNPMPLKAAEQGFHGADVQHKDGSTMIGDWRREYGPKGPQALDSFGHGKSSLASLSNKLAAAPAPAPAGPAGPAGPISTGLDNPMPLKAAEQGFHGADVQHKDGSTMIGDWRREYGPKGPQALDSFGHGKSSLVSVSLGLHAAPAPAPAGPAGPAGPISTGLDNPMPLKAAEQGFHGADVQHKDGSTMIGDWRREYGPKGPQALDSFGHGKSSLASLSNKLAAAPVPAPAGPAGPAGPMSTGLDNPMPLMAAEQGFHGADVQHKDGSTMIGDWRQEYGPNA